MTKEEFKKFAEKKTGKELSSFFQRTPRTIRNWKNGTIPVPHWVEDKLFCVGGRHVMKITPITPVGC